LIYRLPFDSVVDETVPINESFVTLKFWCEVVETVKVDQRIGVNDFALTVIDNDSVGVRDIH